MANPRSPFLGKGSMHPFIHLSIGFWLYTALQCRSSMSSNCLVFHTSGGISSSPAAFLFLIFLRTESSSSCVNGPSLVSNCLLIILVIDSCVIFGGFPSKFSKCCFHSCILSCWFAAFSFALAEFFLLRLYLLLKFYVALEAVLWGGGGNPFILFFLSFSLSLGGGGYGSIRCFRLYLLHYC